MCAVPLVWSASVTFSVGNDSVTCELQACFAKRTAHFLCFEKFLASLRHLGSQFSTAGILRRETARFRSSNCVCFSSSVFTRNAACSVVCWRVRENKGQFFRNDSHLALFRVPGHKVDYHVICENEKFQPLQRNFEA